jgi:AraC-like DNA-binding protein
VDFVGREAVRLFQTTPLSHWVPAQIASPQELMDIFEALQRDAQEEGPLSADLCAAHLRVLLLKLGQRAMPLGRAEPRALATYQRARRYLEEHFVTLQTAEEWAQACHMTPVHLSRLFRRFARPTPYHALIRCKINRAAELLLDRGLLVKEAAEALHFSSPFQFSRAFKRVYGVAPDHFVRHHFRGGREVAASEIDLN